MVAQDLHVACRSLLRRPALSVGVVLTLALGVSATTTVYSVVDGVVLRPLPYADAARLVTVGSLPPGAGGIDPETGLQDLSTMTSVDLQAIGDRARSLERITSVAGLSVTVSDANGIDELVPGGSVGPEFFEIVGVSPAIGRAFVPEEFEFSEELGSMFGNSALITHGYWQRRYGADPEILGQPLEPAGSGAASAIVVGILPEGYRPPEPFFAPEDVPDVYTPMRLPPTEGPIVRVRGGIRALALLRPSATLDEARAELAQIAEEMGSPFPMQTAAQVDERRSLGANGLHAETVGTAASTLWVFLGAAALLMLLAVMNAASLLLVRALDRGQELGVRSALGAGRGRLVRLLLYEAGILTLVGAALGVVVAYGGVASFHRFAPLTMPRLSAVAIDARVLMVAAAIAFVSGLTAGLLPAVRLTARSPSERLRLGGRFMSEPNLRLRSALVGGQLALAVVLLAGAGLLFNSFMRLRAADPGFDPEGLVVMQASPTEGVRIRFGETGDFWRRWDPVLAGLLSVPGVSVAAGTSTLPFQNPTWAPRVLLPNDDPETVREDIVGYVVTPGYLETMGTEIVRGRPLEPSDLPGAERVVLVNEAFVRTHMGASDPLTTVLRRATEGLGASGELVPMRVVGIVEDVVQARAEAAPQPAIYVPYGQADIQQLMTWSQVARTDRAEVSVLPEIRQALSSLGQIPDDLETMAGRMSDARMTPRFQTLLASAFGAMAVLLAGLGLYGALSERVRRQSRDIGIRMALGADASSLIRMVVGQGMRLTVAGLLAGLAGTVALSRVLVTFLFGVEPYDPLTLLAVALLLMAVGLLACVVPARRATALDPVSVLNVE